MVCIKKMNKVYVILTNDSKDTVSVLYCLLSITYYR